MQPDKLLAIAREVESIRDRLKDDEEEQLVKDAEQLRLQIAVRRWQRIEEQNKRADRSKKHDDLA